ncbi:MAG TPA: hypothetical protein VMT17_11090 [Anaeromyxobacteraceae bacterium]|nr:hypothetical protein [Anaeromyxobacteraceae bacterium]
MSTLHLLFFLLVIAYLGGFLVGGRGTRSGGLPSGSEWLVLGYLLGPAALGTLGGQDIATLTPVAIVAIGWVALLAGLTYGTDGARRVPPGRIVLGASVALLPGAAVAATTWIVLARFPGASAVVPGAHDRLVAALGTGAVLSGTTHRAVAWAVSRLGARGALTELVGDVSQAGAIVPVLAAEAIIGADRSRGVAAMPGAGIGLGALLGLLTALLLGREMRKPWLWALLFGVSLFATGVAEQLDVSTVAALFSLGLFAALASPLRGAIRQLPAELEGAIVFPLLFIAGARVSLPGVAVLWATGAALAARIAGSLAGGFLVSLAAPAARREGPALGLALAAAGPLQVTVATAFRIRYPGPAGELIVLAAAAAAVAGEFIGPPALRRALRRAGELPASPPAAAGESAAEVIP